jgi:hypothetical protein
MEEYDKFQESQTSMGTRQEEWIKQVKNFEIKSQKIMSDTQIEFENKLKGKAVDIGRVFCSLVNEVDSCKRTCE